MQDYVRQGKPIFAFLQDPGQPGSRRILLDCSWSCCYFPAQPRLETTQRPMGLHPRSLVSKRASTTLASRHFRTTCSAESGGWRCPAIIRLIYGMDSGGRTGWRFAIRWRESSVRDRRRCRHSHYAKSSLPSSITGFASSRRFFCHPDIHPEALGDVGVTHP